MATLNRNNSNWSFEERRKINENWDILEGLANSTASGNNGLKQEVDQLKITVSQNTVRVTESNQISNQATVQANNASRIASEAEVKSTRAENNSNQANMIAKGIDDKATNALRTSASANAKSNEAILIANNSRETVENVQGQFNQIIADAGNSNPEVVASRIDSETGEAFVSLSQRLDQQHNGINTQLDQIKEKQSTRFEFMGPAFDTSGDDVHVSWTHTNVAFDADTEQFLVVYNAQPSHGLVNNKTYCRLKPKYGNFSERIVIADRIAEGISCKTQSAGICANGDYVAIVCHVSDRPITSHVYRSTDRGLTWNYDRQIFVGDAAVSPYSGDIAGFKRLRSGRVILWYWDSNVGRAIYSDDNCVTWRDATVPYAPKVTEPTFVELKDGTIIGYGRDNVTDGNDHIDAPKTAWFLRSNDSGLTWLPAVKSQSITDMSNNNCAFIQRDDGLIEIVYGSRRAQSDKKASIYQAITTDDAIKNDMWSKSVRIGTGNAIPNVASDVINGDFGYFGAATDDEGTSLVFYYDGTKSKSNIMLLQGNSYTHKTTMVTPLKNAQNTAEGLEVTDTLVLGNYSGKNGRIIGKRQAIGAPNYFDFSISSGGELFLDLYSNSTRINRLRIGRNGEAAATGSIVVGNDVAKLNNASGRGAMSLKAMTNVFEVLGFTDGNGKIRLSDGNTTLMDLAISADGIIPGVDKQPSLGTTTKRFYNAYFSGVVGTPSYTTATRPTTGLIRGCMVFDQTLGKPIWWNGTGWVDATGAII